MRELSVLGAPELRNENRRNRCEVSLNQEKVNALCSSANW